MQPNESYNFGGHYYYWLNLLMMNIMLKPPPKLDHSIKLGYCTSKTLGSSWFSGGEGRQSDSLSLCLRCVADVL